MDRISVLEMLRYWREIKTFLEDRNVNITKLITDVEKLIVDAKPIVADVEAIVADFQATPPAGEPVQANGVIIAKLLALLEKLATNPAVLQIILALFGLAEVSPTPNRSAC